MKPLSRALALSALAVPLVAAAGCGEESDTASKQQKQQSTGQQGGTPAVQATPGTVIARGNFTGASGHVVTGSVSIVKTANGTQVQLSSDFSLDNGPGPWVGFGSNGQYDKSAELSKLGALSGPRSYAVPASIDVSKYNEFYVWCKPFGVPLGVARLN
ncbi:MAG: hypothetical protein Kow0032_07060 [Methyloligellaceae bacterium]